MTGTLLSFSADGDLDPRARRHAQHVRNSRRSARGGGLVILLVVIALRPQLLGDLAPRRCGCTSCATACISSRNICWAMARHVLPLATVFALEFMMPAWAALLAALFLGER